MMGIGELNWINDWIGIPFQSGGRSKNGLDCYGLVCAIYQEKLGLTLPDWCTDAEIDWEGDETALTTIDTPVDFCLVRTPRAGSMPDHWGVFLGGGVLSVGASGCQFVMRDKYLEMNPRADFLVYTPGGVQ